MDKPEDVMCDNFLPHSPHFWSDVAWHTEQSNRVYNCLGIRTLDELKLVLDVYVSVPMAKAQVLACGIRVTEDDDGKVTFKADREVPTRQIWNERGRII